MKPALLFVLAFLTSIFTANVNAQDTCSELVEAAMNSTTESCSETGRNQACYGSNLIESVFSPEFDASFADPGDIASIVQIEELRLSPLDEDNSYWGIAFLVVQANLPDTLPGQNVAMILFGDVQVKNAGGDMVTLPEIEAVASGAVNVRSGPSTSFEAVGGLNSGDSISPDGRNQNADWLRYTRDDGNFGWVFAPLLTISGDVAALPVVDVSAEPGSVFAPMQAFYFSTGIGRLQCREAPESGILIQSPSGQSVELMINDVEIRFQSTAFLQAVPGDDMLVATLDGVLDVTAENETVIIPAGSQTHIPLDADSSATGQPSAPEPIDRRSIEDLPLQLLQAPVEMPEALLPDEIETIIAEIQAERYKGTPFGHWQAVDVDGSNMTLDLTDLGNGQVDAYWYDDGASVCGEAMPPATLTGTGTMTGENTFTINFTINCESGQPGITGAAISYTYNESFETLNDGSVIWTRP